MKKKKKLSNRKKDRKVFRKTAISTKDININPSVPRGGIRL